MRCRRHIEFARPQVKKKKKNTRLMTCLPIRVCIILMSCTGADFGCHANGQRDFRGLLFVWKPIVVSVIPEEPTTQDSVSWKFASLFTYSEIC